MNNLLMMAKLANKNSQGAEPAHHADLKKRSYILEARRKTDRARWTAWLAELWATAQDYFNLLVWPMRPTKSSLEFERLVDAAFENLRRHDDED